MIDVTTAGPTGARPEQAIARAVSAVEKAVDGAAWLAALTPPDNDTRPRTAAALLAHPVAAAAGIRRAAGDLLAVPLQEQGDADGDAAPAGAAGRGDDRAGFRQMAQTGQMTGAGPDMGSPPVSRG